MRLSWNEIRARAARFSDEWKDETYERGEAQTFYNEFFDIFGVRRRRVATFEEPVRKLGDKRGYIDLFWKGLLIVEQKSAGQNLIRAREQALDYFPGLKEPELPRYVLVSDFRTFELTDLETNERASFALADLARNIEKFGFVLGYEKRSFREQDPVNIEAAELMGELHDALKASGYTGHNLERFLVRLLFCLFADDTGIFEPRDIFTDLIRDRTREDGSDTGLWLAKLFEVLNTPEDQREDELDEDLTDFPYVNGDLFAETLRIPSFNKKMRQVLIDACEFYWERISPAIFGSLFQFVMNPRQRRVEGAHYTNETCILKVVEPLFLDELRSEFEHAKALTRDRAKRLEALHQKIANMRFLDPACGCGNFLVIAYRELRSLELEILHALFDRKEQERLFDFDPVANAKINVDQFAGIEFSEFPARIAEVALWMMDHIMNVKLSLEFHENYARIPLKRSPRILHRDALDCDWNEALASKDCSFVLGNPPFVGSKYQTAQQRTQVQQIAKLGGSGGTLDYVAAWFIKAGEYVRAGKARIGFVATNSITQGEQVAQLWPILFDRHGLEISFAHRTFEWESEARGAAHVHVVIIGLARRTEESNEKRLFSYEKLRGDPIETRHRALSPYLIDASALDDPHLIIQESRAPLNGLPKLNSGTQPIDDGHYIFTDEEKTVFLAREPRAKRFLRPYIGTTEFLSNTPRWILCLQSAEPSELKALPAVLDRMRKVQAFRSASKRKGTLAIANQATRFNVEVIPDAQFLVIPKYGSERRDYYPLGFVQPPMVPSDLIFTSTECGLAEFGLLQSRMHMAWLRQVGGRMKNDPRYSIDLVYNTFPIPTLSDANRKAIADAAGKVLDVRASSGTSNLEELYDPLLMPPALRAAHQRLDTVVDRLYRSAPFTSERERVEFLMGLYEQHRAPLVAVSPASRRKRKG